MRYSILESVDLFSCIFFYLLTEKTPLCAKYIVSSFSRMHSDGIEDGSKRYKTERLKQSDTSSDARKAKDGIHPDAEKEPLAPWPDNINPYTGESGGPKGPEPTRFGDWERKGRVSDF